MDAKLLSFVSEFELDRRQGIYLRLFGDYWVLIRRSGNTPQLWSTEHKEWQVEDALQDKFLFASADNAWKCYKADIRGR